MGLYFLVMAPIFAALLLYLLPMRYTRWAALAIQAGAVFFSARFFLTVRSAGAPLVHQTGGPGMLGIELYCDRTAAVFLMLVTVLFLAAMIYILTQESRDRLFIFLMVTLESLIMLVFLSRDLFNICVAVEVSTVLCGILIMYKRDSRSLYDGLVYLLTNIAGMLFFLLGVGLLYRQFGVLSITLIGAAMAENDGRTMLLPYAFVMTGVCLKCAFMPVFSWLPKAHGTPGAPSEVSAILSGLYVKGGVYLFMRMQEMFAPAIGMDMFFLTVGILTGVGGVALALCQRDIKLILAYHTISQLGLILIGLTLGNEYARNGALLHIVNHALFKFVLFLTAGMIIDRYGTRDVYGIHGVMRRMPWVGAAMLAGILGITGAPLFNGSISKYLIQAGSRDRWAEIFIVLINLGTVLSFIKYGHMLTGGGKQPRQPMDRTRTGVVTALSALCLLTGIMGPPLARWLFGFHISIAVTEYLHKALIWAAGMAAGWAVYRWVVSRRAFFRKGFNLELSFNNACACIAGFFVLMLAVGWVCA